MLEYFYQVSRKSVKYLEAVIIFLQLNPEINLRICLEKYWRRSKVNKSG